MFCKKCGNNVSDDVILCPHCGEQLREAPVYEDRNAVAIVGFVFSFLVAIVGLICSAVGLKRANNGAAHKGLAIAGLIISILSMVLSVISYYILTPIIMQYVEYILSMI